MENKEKDKMMSEAGIDKLMEKQIQTLSNVMANGLNPKELYQLIKKTYTHEELVFLAFMGIEDKRTIFTDRMKTFFGEDTHYIQ